MEGRLVPRFDAPSASNAPVRHEQRPGRLPDRRPDKRSEKRSERPKPPKTQVLGSGAVLKLVRDAQLGRGSNPIFICFDLEMFEFNPNKVLELGVCVLDLADLKHLEAGDRAQAWVTKVKYHHLLATEHAHLRNGKYCPGHPEHFLFGTTHLMHLNAFGPFVESLLPKENFEDPKMARPIYLVGHSFHDDNRLLERLNFRSWPPMGHAGTIDTQKVASGVLSKRFNHQVGLSKLLDALGIPYAKLHNGGNDAAFTMHALLSLLNLSEEQQAHLEPPPPNLSAMARSWAGEIESEIEPPKRKRPKKNHVKEQKPRPNEDSEEPLIDL